MLGAVKGDGERRGFFLLMDCGLGVDASVGGLVRRGVVSWCED